MKLDYATILAISKKAEEIDCLNWDLPVSLALQISRVLGKLQSEIAVFEKERMKLIKKYAEQDEDGQIKTDDNGNAVLADPESFSEEYREMVQEEIDVGFEPIKIDFDKLEAKDILKKPSEVAWLLPLVDESSFS